MIESPHEKRRYDPKAQKRIYLLDKSQASDPQIDVIFTDKTALQAVRFRHFMRDCRDLLGDRRELDAHAEEVRVETRRFLDDAYQDILKHFDPKVVRLKKPEFDIREGLSHGIS